MASIKITCPVCGGRHLGINTVTKAFKCFSNECPSALILKRFPFVYGQAFSDFVDSFYTNPLEQKPKVVIQLDPKGLYSDLRTRPLVCGKVKPAEESVIYPQAILDTAEQFSDVLWHYYGEVKMGHLDKNATNPNEVIGYNWIRRIYYYENEKRSKVCHPFFESLDGKLLMTHIIHPAQLYGLHRWNGGNFTFVVEGELVSDWVMDNWKMPAVSIRGSFYTNTDALIVALQALKSRGVYYIGIIPDVDTTGLDKAFTIKKVALYTGLFAKIAPKSAAARFPRELDVDLGNQLDYSVHEFALRCL